ncbi:ABC transporter substrate-binding protein [Anaerococcus sp. AGMB09787]|uniref:ABC transporter substrate-binding protein n=1 Tax=Anaerococcus sp. AGMB09787 TaxID=2922869 RepID=UPI001FAF5673|nr:ABC transporter substrate-binding protein [Anaerococcus sp. AGMB09787]
MNKKFLSLALSTMMLLTACGGGNSNQPAENASTDQGAETATTEVAETNEGADQEGKSLRMLFDKQGEGTNFDTPWWNRGDIYKVITFRSLFKANPELTEFEPDLLADYTMADDGMSYEFNLKEGVKWSDGEALTGDDVKFSIEGALKGAKVNSIYTGAFSSIKGASAYKDGSAEEVEGIKVDGNKVTLEMEKSVGNMIPVLSQFAILPQHGFEGVDMTEYHTADFWKAPITNGMYKVKEVVTDSYIALEPNENYENQAPKIQSVVVNIVPSDAKLNSVLGDQADVFNTKAPTEVTSVDKKENWEGQTVDTLFYYYLVFNQTGNEQRPANKWVQNPKFRQAIYYAIDRDNLTASLFPELAEKSTYGVPEKDSENKNTELEKFDYNPEKAKELLQEIGYTDDQPLEFRYYMADQASVDLYNSIAQNLQAVGISVNVQKFAGDATQELMELRNYDFALKGLSAFGYEEWYGEYVPQNNNLVKVFGEEVGSKYDAKYQELLQETDETKRAEILKELQKIEAEDLSKEVIFMLKNDIFVNTDNVETNGAKFTNPWFAADIGFENWELK